MNKLKEVRNKLKKNNKGFSLVELIVVIVILAILIGVTIGGIYQYVNKSRVNTDINNAASIQSVLATIATDENMTKITKDNPASISWSKSTDAKTVTNDITVDKDNTYIFNQLKKILTDGFPESKSNGYFKIEISNDGDGNITATCRVYSDAEFKNQLVAK